MTIKPLWLLLLTSALAMAWAPLLISSLYRFKICRWVRDEVDDKIKVRALKAGTPIMGGILIVVSVVLVTWLFNLSSQSYLLIFLLLAGAVVGGVDDLRCVLGMRRGNNHNHQGSKPIFRWGDYRWTVKGMVLFPWVYFKEFFRALGSYPTSGFKPWEKTLLQAGIALVIGAWLYFKLGWNTLWLPFFGEVAIGFWYLPLLVISLTFFAGAMGITDGMDGLSAGTMAACFTAYLAVASALGYPGIAAFCGTVVGALLTFLYFNIFPARIEMSDVGTVPLGMLVALIPFLLHRELIMVVAGSVFVAEALSVVIQVYSVKKRGKRVFKMAPLHHHFEMLGWPETKVTMRFWLAASFTAFVAVLAALL